MGGGQINESDKDMREQKVEVERRDEEGRVSETGYERLSNPQRTKASQSMREVIWDAASRRLDSENTTSRPYVRSQEYSISRSPSPDTQRRRDDRERKLMRDEGLFASDHHPARRSGVRPTGASIEYANVCRRCDDGRDESPMSPSNLDLLTRDVDKCRTCSERRTNLLNELHPLLLEEEGDSEKVRMLQKILNNGALEIAHLLALLDREIGVEELEWKQATRPLIRRDILAANKHNVNKVTVLYHEYSRLLGAPRVRRSVPGGQVETRQREDVRERLQREDAMPSAMRRRGPDGGGLTPGSERETHNSRYTPRLQGDRQPLPQRSRGSREGESTTSRDERYHDSGQANWW